MAPASWVTALPGLKGIMAVAAGGWASFAQDATGTVWALGLGAGKTPVALPH